MRKQSRRMALCGMMVALGVVAMLLGGVIPLATFICPAIAGLALVPVRAESGRKLALGAYVAIAGLSLILSPDKESALLFAFLGYYPVLKEFLDRVRLRLFRLLSKLAVFNAAAGAMMLVIAYVLNLQAIMAEYEEMGRLGLAAFILLANLTLLLYDRLLAIVEILYQKRIRPRLMHGA